MNSVIQGLSAVEDQEVLTRLFTLDELCVNPDNPRQSRNPCYEEIKASIRAGGLNSVPLVTRDPRLPAGLWTFSDGGNTRYAIMRELWQETGDERFYRMTCAIKPWPGRFQCLAGHLTENETHGRLTFIDKALSIQRAREVLEEERGNKVSLRALASALNASGFPVHFSEISRMEDTIKYLYPWLPELLASGFGGKGMRQLLALRHNAVAAWDRFRLERSLESKVSFSDVFGACCRKFDDPDLWSLEMFTDELIGDLLLAFPCPSLNYDSWLLELRGTRKSPVIKTQAVEPALPQVDQQAHAVSSIVNHQKVSDCEVAPEDPEDPQLASQSEPCEEMATEGSNTQPEDSGAQAAPADEIETLWHINAFQDDVEHLQSAAWKISWEIASAHGCEAFLQPCSEDIASMGYTVLSDNNIPCVARFLAALINENVEQAERHSSAFMLIGSSESSTPLFDDEQILKLFRLIRVLRRLRELQRQSVVASGS